ncbi:MAG: cytochrome c oxidase subunit 3 [Pseudomonadales bacterium]|nr:cytochrome c oxidase subunit 3 [Pseudomonadales bacterium]NRA18736.1 cytochrome c oxidase subunit 3 [Oceanospirillaceae bacterium]
MDSQTQEYQEYYVPTQSYFPIVASVSLFCLAFGAASVLTAVENTGDMGMIMLFTGFILLFFVIISWFTKVAAESRDGLYSAQMDVSFRWGMGWFISSEVMFFAAFFGALFYIRVFSVPWLGGEGDKGVSNMLWEGFVSQWPLMTTPDPSLFKGPAQVVDPWHIPLLNTILLISSSLTLTLSHKALKLNNRTWTSIWLAVTVVLGAVFLYYQVLEYHEAYTELGLTLSAGVYGSTFFILTGFHGLHVTIGTIMLLCILVRVLEGEFTGKKHFAFEAVAWYWHFVDVVWVGLFIFVYIL